jgi:hypothetical protein
VTSGIQNLLPDHIEDSAPDVEGPVVRACPPSNNDYEQLATGKAYISLEAMSPKSACSVQNRLTHEKRPHMLRYQAEREIGKLANSPLMKHGAMTLHVKLK